MPFFFSTATVLSCQVRRVNHEIAVASSDIPIFFRFRSPLIWLLAFVVSTGSARVYDAETMSEICLLYRVVENCLSHGGAADVALIAEKGGGRRNQEQHIGKEPQRKNRCDSPRQQKRTLTLSSGVFELEFELEALATIFAVV